MTPKGWNDNFSVGQPVIYFPVRGSFDNHHIGRTKTEAWDSGAGDTLVGVEGKSGGLFIEHLVILTEEDIEKISSYRPITPTQENP